MRRKRVKNLLIECPACEREVNVDDQDVQKKEDGLDLIVTCPHCQERFILQRTKWVRQLLKAKHAIIKDKAGKKQTIKI